ncbi:chemotaxis protein CheW [Massilia sp. PAMC28688]|uniref:chemotaxis protein CheW n=1 Tax=Massilia sp. PAMC28688 TaxID=2861283 RepID=UPI001C63B38C|nr:chemotaxis protein CheW [Massilia sp. PAMC28688]QYF93938.1 chemotaxis protein CheW [Massilia sp. PAMC28688]
MKVLVFSIGPDRYALPLAALARVVPVAELKQVALAPPYVAGLLDLHGEPVPVVDLSQLAGFPRQDTWFDTRIMLTDYPLPGGGSALLGLLAEHVMGVETLDLAALRETGVAGAPFLGQVASGPDGMLQLLEPGQLLPAEVRAALFPQQVRA